MDVDRNSAGNGEEACEFAFDAGILTLPFSHVCSPMVFEMRSPNSQIQEYQGPAPRIVISSHERKRVGQTVETVSGATLW